MKALPSERGQAMILIVFAIIGLFGIAALAVDMGQIFAARRSAQNAADAAALAAAYEAATNGTTDEDALRDVADTIANTNGFNNDNVTNWVEFHNAPVDGPYCQDCPESVVEDGTDYHQVKITALLKPIFAQFIFNGVEKVTVEAVAHATTADDVSAGNALMSLSKSEDSMLYNGNTGVQVTGGNIRSNGRITKTGASGSITVDKDKPEKDKAHIYYGENTKDGMSGHGEVLSPTAEYSAPVNISGFKEPACPKLADVQAAGSGWGDEADGKYGYYSKQDTTTGTTTYYHPYGLYIENLQPGIHCIDGNDYVQVDKKGKTTKTYVEGGIDKGNYTGTGVLVVLLKGGIKETGNDSINFKAAGNMIDANGNQFGGLVFYAPASNTSELKFGGNSEFYLYGTFFAPGATCDVGGTDGTTAIHSAIICNMIRLHGTPDVIINFAPEQLYHFPPRVELVQ